MPTKIKKHETQLVVLSPMSLYDPADLRKAILQFCAELPELLPTKWGFWEPLPHDFDLSRPMDWTPMRGPPRPGDSPFFERRKFPKASFSVSPKLKITVGDTHSFISCTTYLGEFDQQRLVSYLKLASRTFAADFAYINKQPHEGEFDRVRYPSYSATRFPIVTHDLRKFIPDALWANIYGKPYVQIFGLQKLLSAPAFKIEQLGPEMVYIQLTERLDDAIHDFVKFQTARDAFKAHLKSSNAFFDYTLPPDHRYNVPVFHLQDDVDERFDLIPKPDVLLADVEKRFAEGHITTSADLAQVTKQIEETLGLELARPNDADYQFDEVERLSEFLEKLRLHVITHKIKVTEETAGILTMFR